MWPFIAMAAFGAIFLVVVVLFWVRAHLSGERVGQVRCVGDLSRFGAFAAHVELRVTRQIKDDPDKPTVDLLVQGPGFSQLSVLTPKQARRIAALIEEALGATP